MSQLCAPFDHEPGRAASERVRDEPVAVSLPAAQGEEQAAGHHLARIRVVGREGVADLGVSDLTAAGCLEELEESQTHVYMKPVALVGRYEPADDHGLGALLPIRRGGQVAVSQVPGGCAD